jgi:hypothetical protein
VQARSEDAALLPIECLFHEGGKTLAYVKSASGWEKRPVELGLTNYIAAVVASGLREGEVVAAERPAHAIFP